MALRTAPKRKVDLDLLDNLQREIFGSQLVEEPKMSQIENEERKPKQKKEQFNNNFENKLNKPSEFQQENKQIGLKTEKTEIETAVKLKNSETEETSKNWKLKIGNLETIAIKIKSGKAGQGRNTTRPFTIPRTLIIDTTRLKAKFRTIDEQFTQNVIIDFLMREALGVTTPENYQFLRAEAFKLVKRAEETTRRSLTITEEVVYQMSELKAGINLETGKKYSNDEIFSTLLAIGVTGLYEDEVLN